MADARWRCQGDSASHGLPRTARYFQTGRFGSTSGVPQPSRERLAFAALLAGAVGIAFAPIFVRLSETGPVATAFYRLAFALPFLWLWMRLEGRAGTPAAPAPLTPLDHRQLALAGLFFAGDLALWHWSIQLTSVANATLLANLAPIFVTLGARLLFGERITARFLAGLAVALAGMVLLVGSSVQLSQRHLLGDALGVLTAMFYGAYMLSVKRLRERFSTATIMGWSGVSAGGALLAIALVSGERMAAVTLPGWLLLVALALVSQVGGQSFIAFAFAHLSAPFASLSLLFQPVVAAVLAWALLDEQLRVTQGLGGAVILTGIALASQARWVAPARPRVQPAPAGNGSDTR
jgi:drug/metabolite transporter (DMT)-like permease